MGRDSVGDLRLSVGCDRNGMWNCETPCSNYCHKASHPGHRTQRGAQPELAATLRASRPGGAIRIAHYDVIDDVITQKL